MASRTRASRAGLDRVLWLVGCASAASPRSRATIRASRATSCRLFRPSLLMSATQPLRPARAPTSPGSSPGTRSYYLNGPLRKFYGLPGDITDAAFTATDMPGEDRVGIVTHPALAAMLARPAESNPISRGLFVRRSLLCQSLPPPPTNIVIPQLAPVSPMLSTRDRLDQHATVALCASCHNLIDPPGYALREASTRCLGDTARPTAARPSTRRAT